MTKFSGGRKLRWMTPPHTTLWYNACYNYARVLAQSGPNYGPYQPATMIDTAYKIDMDKLRYAGKYQDTFRDGNFRYHIFWDDIDLKEIRIREDGNYFLPEPCFDATDPETQWWEESDSDGGGGKKKRKSLKKKSKSKRRKSLKKKQRKTKRKGRR
jgi:hypothetical protein